MCRYSLDSSHNPSPWARDADEPKERLRRRLLKNGRTSSRMINANRYIFAIYLPGLVVLHAKIGQRISYRSDARLPTLYHVMRRPIAMRNRAGGEVNIRQYFLSLRRIIVLV